MDEIRTLILEDGSKFYIAFDSDRKPCRHCRRIIHWGYQSNGRAGSIEENGGKFRLHFSRCQKMLDKRYSREYIPLTNGTETDESRFMGIRIEKRRYVR